MSDRRNPFKEIERMFDRMSSQFEDVEQLGGGDLSVDVAETDESIRVTADLPGFDREDIDVTVRKNRLTIQAEREREEESEDEEYHRRERVHRAVSRTVRLPGQVDEEAASASYQNGVLEVTLPKVEATEDGHEIDID